MPIIISQVEKARELVQNAQDKLSEMDIILNTVNEAVLEDLKGNVIIDITSNQKANLLQEYEKRKQSLITAVNDLL